MENQNFNKSQFFRYSEKSSDSDKIKPQTRMFNNAKKYNHNFFIARDYQYTDSTTKELTTKKEYASFNNIKEFIRWRDNNLDETSLYELLGDELIEIYDFDGSYSKSCCLNDDGSFRTYQEIVDEFIDARLDFQEEFYSDIPLVRSNFLVKHTLDPDNLGTSKEKVSFHIIVRNNYKFRTIKDLKNFTQKFSKYVKDIYPKVTIDKSIYSNNRVFRILGCCKLGQEKRKSFRYKNFTTVNDTCDERLFYASYLEGSESYYPSIGDDEDFIIPVPQLDEWITSGKSSDIPTLIKMILSDISSEKSKLCDTEIKNKLNYDTWKNLVFAMFNSQVPLFKAEGIGYTDSKVVEQLFNLVFPFYRHCETIKLDETFKNMLQYTGAYSALNLGWLLHYASFNDEFKTKMPDVYVKLKSARDLKFYRKMMKTSKKLDLDNSPIQHIHEFKSLSQLTYKGWYTVENIQNIINNICCNVCGGGKNYIYVKAKNYDKDAKKFNTYYTINKYKDLTAPDGFLNCSIYVINEDFEKELEAYTAQQEVIASGIVINPKKLLLYPSFKDQVETCKDRLDHKSIITNMMNTNIFRTARKAVFEPYMLKDISNTGNSDCLNMFSEFLHLDTLHDNKCKIDNYLNSQLFMNFKMKLCNYSEEPQAFEYIDNYIAHMIQKPSERPDVMIIFSGSQGTGKDCFITFIESLIGNTNTLHIPSMDILLKNFNTSQANKLLVKINEISDKGMNKEKHELLKDKITSTYSRIEPKGKDAFDVDHCARYFGFSNKENILNIENSDRRFMMIKTANDMANNILYHKTIYNEMKNIDIIKSAFKYYATKDISDYTTRIIPDTKYKTSQKIDSLSLTLKFLYNIFEEEKSDLIKIHTDNIYCKFQSWCVASGNTTIVNKQTMTKDYEKLGLIESRILIDKHKKLGYKIEYEELQELFRVFLKNKDMILPKYED